MLSRRIGLVWLIGFIVAVFAYSAFIKSDVNAALEMFRTVQVEGFLRECFVMPRELIDTGTDKRYVRRNDKGQFKESDDVGRASAQDQKRDSKTKPKRGEGDRGDR